MTGLITRFLVLFLGPGEAERGPAGKSQKVSPGAEVPAGQGQHATATTQSGKQYTIHVKENLAYNSIPLALCMHVYDLCVGFVEENKQIKVHLA